MSYSWDLSDDAYRMASAVGNAEMDERRAVDAATGGQKGRKRCQLGALDPDALFLLGEVAGHGAEKYERFNYVRGFPWSWSFDALMRHALQFWDGEDHDGESGLPHMAHVAWHGLTLVTFGERGLGTDDRFPRGGL